MAAAISLAMEQDIITPPSKPRQSKQELGTFACFLAAAGATVMTLCLLGATAAATAWAVSKLWGLPDMFLYGLLAVLAVPVVWATIWTGGRAWHVERRLAQGLDIDTPVFKLTHYFKG